MADNRPIAVFDSGLGGLTVVRAIRRRLATESIIYFGDTARVPYGIKSSPTVSRFAVEIVRYLARFEPKAVVVACNTASAIAMETLADRFDLPMFNVIDPGAREGARISRRGAVGLLATEATVASEAYPRAIGRLVPGARVLAQAAPLLVPLAEEGRDGDDPIVRLAIRDYLDKLRAQNGRLAGLLLGCTHYPLFRDAIAAEAGADIEVVDSADATATMLAGELPAAGLAAGADGPGELHCLVSDNPQRFGRVGSRFLGEPIEEVTYVGPDEFFAVATAHERVK
ncbi:MAG: Glutamate racemase [Phycisphaerae bacterium]|nr:Glutamate racemase [Phycisphaerae bacterium]